MTNKKNTKHALLSSIIALFLCFTMLLGTTFAWFTDSVTSTNNVIKTGTLNVEMYYADGSKAVPADDSSDWKNAKGVAIYTANQLWEPGYTDAKHIKISNEGTLALKYQLAIVPTGEVSKLAEVIDVYLYEVANTDANATQIATRDDIDTSMYVGTLAEVINKGIVQGNLSANTDYTTTIVLKMQESADKNYQDLSIGDDFTIQLLATQYTAESDSFDNQYDADAWVEGMKIYNASDLLAAINAGETELVVMNDIELNGSIVIPASVNTFSPRAAFTGIVLDLNGNEIKGTSGHVIENNGNLLIKNGTVSSIADNGKSAIMNKGTLTVENATLNGAPFAGDGWPSYAVNNKGVMTATNTKITSYHGALCSYGNGALATLSNCEIDMAGILGKTSHGIYTYDGGAVIVNSGVYANKAADQNATGGSVINGNVTVKDGTFSGRVENYFASPVISGGSFDCNVNNFVADGLKTLSAGNRYYIVSENIDAVASTNEELAAAVKDCKEEIVLTAGNFAFDLYNISARDSLIITGCGADTKISFKNLQVRLSQFKNLKIENCTIERMVDKSWGHLVFGSSNENGGVYTISNCIFNGVGTQGIYINQTADATINIDNCTFNGDFGREGAITIQDNDSVFTVNVTNCKFNSIPETSHKIYAVPYKSGSWTLNVDGKFTVANDKQLANALASDVTNIYLLDGTYGVIDVTVNRNVTLAAADGAIVKLAGINGQSNSNTTNLTVKGITIDNSLAAEGWYTGTAQKIKPCVGVWGGSYTFDNCIFYVTGESGAETGIMSWWTTEKNTMTFNECTFNGGNGSARAMQIYGMYDINVEGCTFNTQKDYSIKYVGSEGCKATFKNNTVNNTENFVQTGSATYAGKNYTLVFENNTLANGINSFYVDNDENQTILVDGNRWVVSAAQLANAVAAGETNLYLLDGTYDIYGCGGKTLTINGSKNVVLQVMREHSDGYDGGFDSSTVTFNGITINTAQNSGQYPGYCRMNGTYNNCTVTGTNYCLYGNSSFNHCTFNLKNGYVWTWGAANAEFDNCTFEATDGSAKAILVHNTVETTVKVKDCTFIATTPKTTWDSIPVAAVSIDPENGSPDATVYFEGTNTYSDAFHGLYQVKYSDEVDDVKVYVDGTLVDNVPVGENDK